MSENKRFVLGLILAGLVSYFTSQATSQTKVAVLEEREQNHYNELVKSNSEIKADVKAVLDELRRRP